MDDSMINTINELQEIIDFYKYRNDTLELSEFILDKMDENEKVYATLFDILGVFEDDKDNVNFNYVIENIYSIIDKIEDYISYQKSNLIYIGYEFETEIEDDNKCGNLEDALYYDWELLDDMDDLEIVNINGNWHGTTPSSKKEYEDIRMYY
ncbi:hypothetical protein KD33_07900 [Clostridium sp. NCR]|nr:hypothetical protein KD33_07900 [Clostridium sp. NCR]